jgi:hypothetical protein
MLRFERKHERLAPLRVFVRRILWSLLFAGCTVAVALLLGIAGYRWIAGFGWVDSLLEASMILGGMGPINPLNSNGAKLFASAYALFSGLVFIAIMGVVLAPIIHRIMHSFHFNEQRKLKQ